MRSIWASLGAFAVAAVIVLACSSSAAAADAELSAVASVKQVQVYNATPGKNVKLLRKGKLVGKDRAGSLGAALFRKVKPGKGYRVSQGGAKVAPGPVMSERSTPPNTRFYDQHLKAGGYGYVTMRDGTKLAYNVALPNQAGLGPFPTLIEYSGYGTADPAGPESGIAIIGNLLGYAVIDVNMRGTGCSGGAFDFFEKLQSLDGYDIVETVARQPWVKGKPGMLGISYGGISQLFTAQTQPPSLAAITPLSVIDNTQTTLYPGGILNTGFAFSWAVDRVHDAEPAGPDAGQRWAWKRIEGGDQTCADNQAMHTEAVDLIKKIDRNKFYRPAAADPLDPEKFVDKINVPTFMACQWTDEQTGGHCPTLAAAMTGTDKKWFTYTNGVHTDSLDPETFNRYLDFLDIYVAKRNPAVAGAIAHAAAPFLYGEAFGIDGLTLPPDPIQTQPTLAAAKAMFEQQPSVRVLFDNGAGKDPGQPYPGFERSFDQFPPANNKLQSWYFGNGGKLVDKRKGGGADQFKWDADARPPTNFTGDSGTGNLWTDHPTYEWSQPAKGKSVSYVTKPLAEDTTVLGDGEVQLWVRSKARNADLQATVSEVRPDGKESFVQGGWLRSSARKMDRAESSLGNPVPTLAKRDVKTLSKNKWAKVRVPLYYQGHVYRAGSRIRVTIQAPGGDQPIWSFAETGTEPDKGTPWIAIAHDGKHSSRLILPITPGVKAPTSLPPCPGLRGEPCRDYAQIPNTKFKR